MSKNDALKVVPNPEGKGGFADNPQNIARGRWSKDTSISYWYNKLLRVSLDDFNAFVPETMAQKAAHKAVKQTVNRLDFLKEVTDRTEGKAPMTIDHTNNGGSFENLTESEREARISALMEKLKDVGKTI